MDDIFIGGNRSGDGKQTHGDIPIGKRNTGSADTARGEATGNAGAARHGSSARPLFADRPSGNGRQAFAPSGKGSAESGAPEHTKKQAEKKRSVWGRIKAVILALIVLLGVATGAVFVLFSSVNYNKTGHKDNVFLDSDMLMQDPRVHNILLMGVDRRNANEASRSDTMLLASIDSRHGKIKLTSFMRDSYVYIPELQYSTKLNAACTYGGAQMVMDTIEYNFNIKIDHYLLVDFSLFEDIIDGLGGITVEVTEKEAVYMRDKVHLKSITSGEKVRLNGREGLWYCRIRALDSDFMRTQRQRKVMAAIIKRVKRTNPFKLYCLAADLISDVETDMSPGELTGLAVTGLLLYSHYSVKQGSVPADGTWQDAVKGGQAVLSVDLEANRDYLNDFIYGDKKR